MQPKTLIIIDNDQTSVVTEILDAALALTAFDENVHLWFKDLGVDQLVKHSNNSNASPSAMIEALAFYDIEQIFISKTETHLKLYNQQKFRIATQWIEPSDTATFINNYANIFRFN